MPSVEFSFLAQEWAHPIFWFLFGATTIAWLFKLFPENESGFSNRVLNSFKNWFVLHAFGIQWLDGPHSIHTFGYVMSRPHNMCLVNYIRLRGVNRKKSSLVIKEAYLQSLVTGQKVKLHVGSQRLEAENIQVIGKAAFDLYAILPNTDGAKSDGTINGLSLEKFLRDFSNFEIVIKTNRKKFRFEFNSDETKEWVTTVLMGLMMPQPSPKASILKEE